MEDRDMEKRIHRMEAMMLEREERFMEFTKASNDFISREMQAIKRLELQDMPDQATHLIMCFLGVARKALPAPEMVIGTMKHTMPSAVPMCERYIEFIEEYDRLTDSLIGMEKTMREIMALEVADDEDR